MRELIFSIAKRIGAGIQRNAEDATAAIDGRHYGEATAVILLIIVKILLILAMTLLVLVLAFFNWQFLLVFVGFPAAVIAAIVYNCRKKAPESPIVEVVSPANLRAKAEEFFTLMRDVAYLILRDVSEYTTVICPSHIGAVETAHRFRLQGETIIYEFMAAVSGPVDVQTLREQLQRHIVQRLRSRELPGLTAEVYVSKAGRPFSVIQCLNVVDFGGFVQVSLVFCDESAVVLLEAKERARSEFQRQPDYRDPML